MRHQIKVCGALVAGLLAVAGCSKGGTVNSPNAGGANGTSVSGSSNPGVKAAEAQLKEYMALPKFKSPGPPIDVSSVGGKTILSIPVSSEIPYEIATEQAASKVAKSVGIKWIDWTNQGQPSQWVDGMNHALSQHVNLIDLFGGTNPAALAPQIHAANKANIPVVASHFYDVSQKVPPNIAGAINQNFGLAARLDADWAITHAGPSGHVLAIVSKDLGNPAIAGINGLKSEFAKDCPNCTLHISDVPYADWSSKIPSAVSGALGSDPQITQVVALYDSMTDMVTSGIRTAGKLGQVGISTFNGTPAYLKEIASGSSALQMDVGEDPESMAYAMLDQDMRILTGKPTGNEQLPLRVFDSTNIADAGSPPRMGVGYGNAYIKGYKALWKNSTH